MKLNLNRPIGLILGYVRAISYLKIFILLTSLKLCLVWFSESTKEKNIKKKGLLHFTL